MTLLSHARAEYHYVYHHRHGAQQITLMSARGAAHYHRVIMSFDTPRHEERAIDDMLATRRHYHHLRHARANITRKISSRFIIITPLPLIDAICLHHHHHYHHTRVIIARHTRYRCPIRLYMRAHYAIPSSFSFNIY